MNTAVGAPKRRLLSAPVSMASIPSCHLMGTGRLGRSGGYAPTSKGNLRIETLSTEDARNDQERFLITLVTVCAREKGMMVLPAYCLGRVHP